MSAAATRVVTALWSMLLVMGFSTSTTSGAPAPNSPPVQDLNNKIHSYFVHSKIKYRYVQTVVSCHVVSKGNTFHEFIVIIPESAFVSKFLMEINKEVYTAEVKETQQGREDYIDAIHLRQTAAFVEQNLRDSKKFRVAVYVEAKSNVIFNLTYEHLLTRKLGIYENIININPGQKVQKLKVIVDIDESLKIKNFQVPDLEKPGLIENNYVKSDKTATITWSLNVNRWYELSENNNVIRQFIVKYDLDHYSAPNQVLINNGYFVHFFVPTNLKPLRTHLIFVLDIGDYYTTEHTLSQVKYGMDQILQEISSDNYFSLIVFSAFAQVWTINASQNTSYYQQLGDNQYIFRASKQNIQHAKNFVQNLTRSYGNYDKNTEDAMDKAHSIAKSGETLLKDGLKFPKCIITFLFVSSLEYWNTDQQELIQNISNTNKEKYPIFSLGFGENVDFDFLQKLSLNNNGFAKFIDNALDASLQLCNFYNDILSPVLSDVSFEYVGTQVDIDSVTNKFMNLFFEGTEFRVAGKLKDVASPKFNSILIANSMEGNFNESLAVIRLNSSAISSKTVGDLEKLWAYLTIQQLIDKFELNNNEHSTAKAKALELALKYSLVTPLTTLVVVKPINTITSVTLEKIKPEYNRYKSVTYPNLASKVPYAHNRFTSGYDDHFRIVHNYYYASVQDDNSEECDDDSGEFLSLTSGNVSATQTSIIDSDKESNSTLQSVNELTWLGTSITLNVTNTVYQVLFNSSGQTYQNCTTPDQMHGNCKHLKDCVVSSILASIDTYFPLFCPIETLYAGICCIV